LIRFQAEQFFRSAFFSVGSGHYRGHMKRFLILAGTVIVGGLLGYSIWKASPHTAEEFFKSGKAYYEQKKYSEAIIQCLNAIQKDPRHHDARYLIAQIYADQQDLNSAGAQLRSLLEYYPDDRQGNLDLGRIYLTAGPSDLKYFRESQNIAEKILSKNPQDVEALILKGNALAGVLDYTTSIEMFGKALNLDVRNVAAWMGLGTAEALRKNYSEAERAFLKAVQLDRKNKNALISLANFYRATHNVEKAESALKEAFAAYPSDSLIYLSLAQFYYQIGHFGEVENVLREAQSKQDRSAHSPGPSLALVDFYLTRNRRPDAQRLIVELKNKFPQNLDVLANVAMVFVQDQPDRARPAIHQLLKLYPQNPVGHILLGELQYFSGQDDQADKTLSDDLAINSLFPEPHYFLGLMAVAKGKFGQAQDHYQRSIAVRSRYLPARLALADLFLKKSKVEDAREEVRKALEIQPDSTQALLLKAAIDTVQKDYENAEKELTALKNAEPENALIYRQMGIYYMSRGLTDDAEKSFVHALDLQPESQQILRDLTQFYINHNQTERAIQRIGDIPENKKQAFDYELLGEAYVHAGRLLEAEKSYQKALQKEPGRSSPNMYLATQYFREGRFDEGVQQANLLLAKEPQNAGAYVLKGFIAESRGMLETAKENYRQALNIDPDLAIAANNLAYILAEQGRDIGSALTWAQTARRRLPDSPNNADTLGWIYYKLGRYVLARDQLQFAVSKDPDSPLFQYHLGMIYKETGQIDQAEAALKQALSGKRDFKEKNLAKDALKRISEIKTSNKLPS
jgi:tetratricopeptide (TPR) repeat protein